MAGPWQCGPAIGWGGSVEAGHSLNIAGDVRARARDLVRLLPWIIEADFEDRRPELSRRPGETEAMRLGMPGDCPRPGRTDELSGQRAAFIISTPGRKSKFRELKQQTDEAIGIIQSLICMSSPSHAYASIPRFFCVNIWTQSYFLICLGPDLRAEKFIDCEILPGTNRIYCVFSIMLQF